MKTRIKKHIKKDEKFHVFKSLHLTQHDLTCIVLNSLSPANRSQWRQGFQVAKAPALYPTR